MSLPESIYRLMRIAVVLCTALMLASAATYGGRLMGVAEEESGTPPSSGEQTPVLAVDPVTGSTVAVWSQFDGLQYKIAYSRQQNNRWVDFHYLTFGPGNDTEPRVGVSRIGPYLFWVYNDQSYYYAPVNLSRGRLLAVPKPMTYSSGDTRVNLEGTASSAYNPEGGSDVPVVVDRCPPGQSEPCTPSSPPPDNLSPLREIKPEGGTDVPVVVDAWDLWTVSSQTQCSNQVLTVPRLGGEYIAVLSFENETTDTLSIVSVPTPTPDSFADETGSSTLASDCH